MITVQDIISIVKQNQMKINADNLDESSPLSEQGVDSLDMISILFAIEEKYGVKISEEDITAGKLASLNAIVEYVNQV